MNSAKWVALRWSLGFLVGLIALTGWLHNRPDRDKQIQNLQSQNTQLAREVVSLHYAIGNLRHDHDLLKTEIERKEGQLRRDAASEAGKPN